MSEEQLGVAASPPGHSDEPASGLTAIAGSVPNAGEAEALPPGALPRRPGAEVLLATEEGLFRIIPTDDGEWETERIETN